MRERGRRGWREARGEGEGVKWREWGESVCEREIDREIDREIEGERVRQREREREREREEVTSKGRDRVMKVWVYHFF